MPEQPNILARGLAIDLAPVRVNAISPGLILTEAVLQTSEVWREQMVVNYPLRRAGQPRECAQAYLYAMLSGFITGQTLATEGGALLVKLRKVLNSV